ncbi:MAG: DUF4330 domain-containing protein [Eubacteriales bacterium]|nr:DUF4330 domain-containing protein [Eubacteriales bacterium]
MEMNKKKFRVFDIVIVFAVIILAVGIYYKFFVLGNAAQSSGDVQTVPVSFTVEIEERRQYIVDSLQEGDIVYLSQNTDEEDTVDGTKLVSEDEKIFGTITDVTATPAKQAIVHDDGTVTEGTMQDRYDIQITIACEGQITDGIVQVNDYNLMVNKSFAFLTKYLGTSGKICSITASES